MSSKAIDWETIDFGAMDRQAQTKRLRQSREALAIDFSRASLDPVVLARSPEIGPLYLEAGEPLRLLVFSIVASSRSLPTVASA